MKKIYLYGNWKMNKGIKETSDFINRMKSIINFSDPLKNMLDEDKLEIAVFPSFVSLVTAKMELSGDVPMNIYIGSQNLFYEEKGAFTGEISWSMLKEVNCKYSLIGHSERRHIFKEDDFLISKKVGASLENGITPVLCYGETLEERKKGETENVVKRQIGSVLKSLDADLLKKEIIFAYEPVWAIGTGHSAKPEDAERVCKYTREYIGSIIGAEKSQIVPILYGGSVKASNADQLLNRQNIDGALVGGASLDPASFLGIIKPFLE